MELKITIALTILVVLEVVIDVILKKKKKLNVTELEKYSKNKEATKSNLFMFKCFKYIVCKITLKKAYKTALKGFIIIKIFPVQTQIKPNSKT